MTKPIDTAALNKRLARAMGWQEQVEMPFAWYSPGCKMQLDDCPDFANDFLAKQELVEWLAADDDLWFVFIRRLIGFIKWPEQQSPKAVFDSTFAKAVSEVRYFMTASPLTIALAADAALAEQKG
jgi:hypothetical protein